MKLNPDCVRDILLEIEDCTDFFQSFLYNVADPKPKHLSKYDHSEIIYHIQQCEFSGLITGVRIYENGDYIEIDDLAPAGHEFLANVRQDTIWNNTKTIAGKIGAKSLDALIQISSNVITELIKAQFGLTWPGVGSSIHM